MFSTKRIRLAALVFLAVTLGGVYAYVAPASNVDPAPTDDRPGIQYSRTIRSWSEDLSESAVHSGGIERDLDGNASALFASDQWCGLPRCGNPRLP